MDLRECMDCAAEGNRMVRDPYNKHRCVPRKCGSNSYFGTVDQCFKCIECEKGYEVDLKLNKCVKIKPVCSCTETLEEVNSEWVC
jgi:hypothetical protein